MVETLRTKVLVVGGGTGGTAAALQCARAGVDTLLVSEFGWLGGMLTAAGVSVPDGNELRPWQTGMWGAFLRELQRRQPEGLDHSWVSMFSFDPRLGAEILAAWVTQEQALTWIAAQTPLEVIRQGDRLTAVRFQDYLIYADVIIDGTELGDLLALGDVPHRWGWDWAENFAEPSAPDAPNEMTKTYPVQSPTWVFYLQKNGAKPPKSHGDFAKFATAWDNYGLDFFMNYGGLPRGNFMLNWPLAGNDYGRDANRLLDPSDRQDFFRDAQAHSFAFADYIYQESKGEYGLATGVFPHALGDGSFALMPYIRESRRLVGAETFTEPQLLPQAQGTVAALPCDRAGNVTAIALGNYANDHHYPDFKFPLAPKSIQWGGRWTGTPFTLPYAVLIPAHTEGLLVCEKNIAVSHIANGATRLQPLVMNTGQAAGQAAAIAITEQISPRELDIRVLQEQLLSDRHAPAAVIPLYNLPFDHPEWLQWQRFYLDHPDQYPQDGLCACHAFKSMPTPQAQPYRGVIERAENGAYRVHLSDPQQTLQLITLHPHIHAALSQLQSPQTGQLLGRINPAAPWFVLEDLL